MTRGVRKIKINAREVERLAREGLSQAQIAHMLGISEDTLTKRKQDSPVVAEALKRGRAKIVRELVNILVQQARDGNTSACIFALKNLAGWTDRLSVDVEETIPRPLVIELPFLEGSVIDVASLVEGGPLDEVEVVDEPLPELGLKGE